MTRATVSPPRPGAYSEPLLSRVKRNRFQLFVVVASVLLAELAFRAGALTTGEHLYSDLWFRLTAVRYDPSHVALVVVDDQALAEHGDDPMVFWTPLFAKAAATIRQAGASVIGVDFLFGFTPEDWFKKMNLSGQEGLRDFDLAFRQELNQGKVVLVGATVRGSPGASDGVLLAHSDYLLSLPDADLVKNIGFADLVTDQDGTVRQYELVPRLNLPADQKDGAPRFALGALLAARAAGIDANAGEWQIGNRTIRPGGTATISYVGPPGTIARISLTRVLAPNATNDPSVRALRGKVVIIGGDYQGMNDIHSTPYSGQLLSGAGGFMAGAEIQANIVETLLSGRAIESVPSWLRWLLFFLSAGLTTWWYQRHSPWTGLAILGGAMAVSLLAAFAAFQQSRLLPVAHLQLGLVTAYLLAFSQRLTSEERDKARVKTMFKGYVSDSVVDMLLSSDRKLDLQGQSMRITVLFTDIRQFTTISELLSPRETVEFLNTYYGKVIEVILDEGGRIDKFIGDAVMAEFGVPYPFPDQAERALRAAVRLRDVATEFRTWMHERFPDKPLPEFAVGVGIHTGDAVVGNIGSAARMEFTAVGDTVNVASRLEGETKYLNCVIAASADVVRAANGLVETGTQQTIRVKGRVEPVEVFEIVGMKQ